MNAKASEKRWTDGADNYHGRAVGTCNGKTPNHHIVASLDETARADVGQRGIGGRINIIGFDQSDAGAAVVAADNGGVGTGGES